MNTWQQTWTQLVASWNSFTTSQRAACLGGCGLMLFVLGGVAWWSSRPDYATLVNRLTPTETAEVVAALEADQIPYQLNFAASAVSVPKASLAQARLTIKDQLGLSPAEAEADSQFDLFADPSQIHQRLLRQQESRLARSISQFRSIKSAVVHLSKPASTTFLRDVTPATASVIVELKPGGQLTARDANAIVSLVSHGVEGLRAEDVSVMDTEGRLLTDTSNSEGDVAGQLEYRRRLETELSTKAETMLGEMLGAGRSIVRVTADIDFTATETEQITFDPEGKVKVSETTRSESTTGKPRSGAAGTGSNLPQPSSTGTTDSSTVTKSEENETQYANAETKNTIREAPGKIRRITVAAIVDLSPPEADPTAPATAPANAVTQADVERIVKQAVGFDTRRSDEVEVLVSKIATLPLLPASVPPAVDWEHWVRTGSLGVGAVVALLISWLTLRRRQSAPATVAATESSTPLPVAMAHRVHQLSEQALRNPKAAAAVLQAWLKSEAAGARNEAPSARRRAA